MKKCFKYIMFALLVISHNQVLASTPDSWGYCSDKKAYNDPNFTQPRAEANWVCEAPSAVAAGDQVATNTLRCVSQQKEECVIGAGGDDATVGDHNVPRSAWYGTSSSAGYDIRCECGCFVGNVKILTHLGDLPIALASRNANSYGGLSVAVFDENLAKYKGSRRLLNRDFVVGPEVKPVVKVLTENGVEIDMTDSHPVLVNRHGQLKMITAKELVNNEVVFDRSGSEDRVTSTMSFALPKDANQVYNFDTKGATLFEHIIVANGLKVGDLYWQKRLSESSQRIENILRLATH